MFTRPVCPCDVSIAILLEQFVACGREQCVEFSLNPIIPMQIMCFLQDVVRESGCVVFQTHAVFLDHLERYIGPETDFASRLLINKSCRSVDDLIDISDSLGSVLSSPPGVSPNGAVSPTMISVDSYLGIYLRAFIVEMESMSFEAICNLFTQLSIYRGEAVEAQGQGNCNSNSEMTDNCGSIAAELNAAVAPDYLQRAQWAVMHSDFHEAEELVHDFFDLHNPLSTTTSNEDVKTTGVYSIPGPNNARRHQQAMINMASAAVQTGNYRQALTAVEEAMKIAHQRGDHASVAQALLLLHYVVLGMEAGQKGSGQFEGNVFAVTPRSVLVRCLNQCVAVKMQKLAAQATILFVKQLCENGLSNCDGCSSTSMGHSLEGTSSGSPDRRIGDLWMLLLAASSGEFSLLESHLRKFGILPPAAAKTGAGSSTTPMCVEEPWTTPQEMLLKAQTAHTAVKMWLQLGFLGMAGLECRRLVRQVVNCRHHLPPLVLGDVMSLILSTNALISAVDTSVAVSTGTVQAPLIARSRYDTASAICNQAAEVLRPFSSDSAQREVNGTLILISMLGCSDAQTALQLCIDYIEMNKLVDQSKGTVSAAAVKGHLLLALITSLFESITALDMLKGIEENAILGEITNGREIAVISRAVILKFIGDDPTGQNVTASLLLLESVLDGDSGSSNSNSSVRKRSTAGPTIEGVVAVIVEKFVRDESIEQIFEYLLPTICVMCI